MNARLNHRETSDLDFTVQLGKALHVAPGAADEWLGTFLVRCAEQRHAATAAARSRHDQQPVDAREIASAGEKSERCAA